MTMSNSIDNRKLTGADCLPDSASSLTEIKNQREDGDFNGFQRSGNINHEAYKGRLR